MARKHKKADRRRTGKRKSRIRFPTLRRLYEDASARAKKEYPAILGIHECAPHMYRQPPDDLYSFFGYEEYQQQHWDIDKEDYLEQAESQGNFAGHVVLLSDGQRDRPAVFVMWPAHLTPPDYAFGWMMGVLFHELGHVDDITRGLHVRVDTCVDIIAAEEHAHRYACERIMRESAYVDSYMTEMAPDLPPSLRREWRDHVMQFYRVIMAFYIGEILQGYTRLPQESVRHAAMRVLDSDEMAAFRSFAGSALDEFEP